MSSFDDKAFAKLAKLCRIAYTDEEKTSYVNSLSSILDYMEKLNQLDTEGVSPCTHSVDVVFNALRDDSVLETLSREKFFKNAPSHIGGMIRVPPVLK